MMRWWMKSFAHVSAFGSRIVVGHGSHASLSVFVGNAELRLDRIVRWTTIPRSIGSEDVQAERERLAERYRDLEPAVRQEILGTLLSEARPVADEFPAFQGVMLGRDGRIWIREYPRPTDAETNRWIAFSDNGRFQCRADLPERDQVLEFASDYLLALDRDALGVERVLEYEIAPPSEPR